MTGVTVPRDAWEPAKLPAHLRVTFRVLGEDDEPVAEGKDLPALQRQLRQEVRQVVAAAAPDVARTGLTQWSIGTLPRTIEQVRAGYAVTAYPALVDEGDTVGVKVFDSEAEQARGALGGHPAAAAADRAVAGEVPAGAAEQRGEAGAEPQPARRRAGADRRRGRGGDRQADRRRRRPGLGRRRLRRAARPGPRRPGGHRGRGDGPGPPGARRRVRRRAAARRDPEPGRGGRRWPTSGPSSPGLVHAGFVTETGYARLPDLLRYLTAIERRLDRLPGNPQRDRQQQDRVAVVQKEYQRPARRAAAGPPRQSTAVRQIRWMIEELRVNVFAQALGTPYPVSEQRIYRAMDDAEGR